MNSSTTKHVPILKDEITETLIEPFRSLTSDEPHWILDCTFGGGGHTGAMLEALKSEFPDISHGVMGLDRDIAALERGKARYAEEFKAGRLKLFHGPFSAFEAELPILGILADLGLSSDQLEDPSRGFGFQTSGALDMRMDGTGSERNAQELLQTCREEELAAILTDLGEERFARRIAGAIIRARAQGRLPGTADGLADLIRGAVPAEARHGRIHPATRTFQALRMAVNGELEELDGLLRDVILKVKPGGRVAVLTFHSLEDRAVKSRFRQLAREPESAEGEWKPVNKKPLQPSDAEIRDNPRSRSAKLRVLERVR